ncbi:hypothetical protein SAT01_26990 [Sinomonas atrocyanea]|uniref:hypothetical protein n=1 Tax=Sinomonas atrocyanea TaxID=37927 RepID=UPI00116A70D6|nr:hypothetical protein [Sinomonas atrocyanea]GEB65251.1 hypothetical protein SAT01_26990 [Sinomonas atrocyanea]GGG56027.1 hypothetical protein GCM10007172_03710 [Sinomonas atrocyanea]
MSGVGEVVEDFGTSPGATVAAAEALPAPADALGAGQEMVPDAAALPELELELDGVPEEPLQAVARRATPMPSAASFAARGAAW